EEARQPLLFFDGSTRNERTSDANIGWRPNVPQAEEDDDLMYYDFNEDPVFDSSGTPDIPRGDIDNAPKYRFDQTRWGLRGIDYGGAPVLDINGVNAFLRRIQ
ncbi:MAG: hypothetical protein AAGF47_06770, partial [Planctomycetota bacterium]